jgi:TRAP-type mannitol/chloroaromatic compound transport system permease small subunit
MSFIRAVADLIDGINEWVGRGVSWVTLLLVLVVFVDVVMRYLFATSFVFTQELEWHLFSFVFLMGAGYTLLKDGHVRVDILYQRLGPKGKAAVNLVGVVFFLIPGCYMVIATSWDFVGSSLEVMEGSPDPGGVPYRFIVKSLIPLGFSLLLIQGVSLGLRSLLVLMGEEAGEPGEERPH